MKSLRRLVVLSLALAQLACTSQSPARPSNPLILPIATVKYVASSPAPSGTYIELIVWEDGGLSAGLNPSVHCEHVARPKVHDLSSMFASPSVRSALQNHLVTNIGHDDAFPDPGLLIFLKQSVYAFPSSAVPKSIRAVVDNVDHLFAQASCRAYPQAIGPHIRP